MNRWFDRLPFLGDRIPGKITLSFLMLLLAIVLRLCFYTFDRSICVLAMVFSFCGDIFLNHNKDHTKQTKIDLILGGIAFVAAHLCFCLAYYQKTKINNFPILNNGAILAVGILIVITIIMLMRFSEKDKQSKDNKLFAFGIVYLWLTGINYTTIFSYAYSIRSMESIAAIGGLLFLSSDIIIGCEKFLGLKSKLARELVWWLYPIGQIILIIMA